MSMSWYCKPLDPDELIVEECVHCEHFKHNMSDTINGACTVRKGTKKYNHLCSSFSWSGFARNKYKMG